MESENGLSHSDEKTHEKISLINTAETGIIKENTIENKFEDKTSESGSLSNFAILRAKSTENTDEKKLVGTSSLSNSEKVEEDTFENKYEKISVRSSRSPINKDVSKIKGDEKSHQSSSCSSLLEGTKREDIGDIKSFESSFPNSHANIEDKSNEQTRERILLSTPIEFKRISNIESIKEKTLDRNESALLEGGASLPLTSLQDEAMKVCAYDPNRADNRSKYGSDKDFLGKLTELQRAEGQILDPAVAAAALTHAAGGEHRDSQISNHDPDPGRRIEDPVQQSDPYEAISVDGDEADYLNDMQQCYEKLCYSKDDLFSRANIFSCLGFFFCVASIFMNSCDPSLFPFVVAFTILSAICFIVFSIHLVRMISHMDFSG